MCFAVTLMFVSFKLPSDCERPKKEGCFVYFNEFVKITVCLMNKDQYLTEIRISCCKMF